MESLKQGKGRVVESNHYLILGWSDKVCIAQFPGCACEPLAFTRWLACGTHTQVPSIVRNLILAGGRGESRTIVIVSGETSCRAAVQCC